MFDSTEIMPCKQKGTGNQLLVFFPNQGVKMAYAIRLFGLCRMMNWHKPNGRVGYAPEKIPTKKLQKNTLLSKKPKKIWPFKKKALPLHPQTKNKGA